jgi:hypothetical protein
MRKEGRVAHMGEKGSAQAVLLRKFEEKRPLERLWCRNNNNNKKKNENES